MSELTPERILSAYAEGFFPFPESESSKEIPWVSPDPRAVLFFKDLHVSRSLKRTLNKCEYVLTVDKDFPGVVRHCASFRTKDRWDTWINETLAQAYLELHRLDYAHSVECWEIQPSGHDLLVAGIYCVEHQGIVSAESMFTYRDNASKVALLYLADHLSSKGIEWMDVQYQSPFLKSLGAREISREDYLRLLREARETPRAKCF